MTRLGRLDRWLSERESVSRGWYIMMWGIIIFGLVQDIIHGRPGENVVMFLSWVFAFGVIGWLVVRWCIRYHERRIRQRQWNYDKYTSIINRWGPLVNMYMDQAEMAHREGEEAQMCQYVRDARDMNHKVVEWKRQRGDYKKGGATR